MGYSLHHVAAFGAPFQVVHEQIVDIGATGAHMVQNHVRKLLFVLQGECRHQIVGGSGAASDVTLRPGDILALPFHCEQRYSRTEPGGTNRLHVIRLSFDPECLPPLPFGTRDDTPPPPADGDATLWAAYALRETRRYRAGDDAAIAETLLQLRFEAERRPPGYPLLVHSLCVRLTLLFARAGMPASMPASGGDDTLPTRREGGAVYHVGAVKAYLRAHLREPICLAEVAAAVGLTEEHVARLFKSVTGQTVFEHVRHLRIGEAKSLLASTDRNLSEIARQTGFASLTVFSRNFTRREGITPSEYRRRIARQIG